MVYSLPSLYEKHALKYYSTLMMSSFSTGFHRNNFVHSLQIKYRQYTYLAHRVTTDFVLKP